MANQKIEVKKSPGTILRDIHLSIGGDDPQASGEAKRLVKLLFLGANPDGTAHLRLDHEVKAIGEALRASPLADRFKLEQVWAVGDRDLQDGLLRYHPNIVHLSGHGNLAGRLELEVEPGPRPVAVTASEEEWVQALAGVFAAARGSVRCVVLNACHTEIAARAIAECVDCVIGMSNGISDAAALRFSWALYNALGHGTSVKAAFDLASAQITLGGWSQRAVPQLFAPKIDPATITFV